MTDPSSPPNQPAERAVHNSWLAPVIGSMLLLLPTIASVQVWLADAPGKIWLAVLATVALSFGIIAWRFRRSLVLGMGLLAASVLIVVPAYLYGVDGAELAIAGVPFDIFVPILFLVSLALAAWDLARLPRLPVWASFIAPALAIFAAVPVVMGLIEGVPFIEVLVGLWTLPYWTQGAWFGAAVFLPIALLVSLLRTSLPAWRAEPFRTGVALATIAIYLSSTLASSFAMSTRGLFNVMAFVPLPLYRIEKSMTDAMQSDLAADASVQSDTDTQLVKTPKTAPVIGNSSTSALRPGNVQAPIHEYRSALEKLRDELVPAEFDPDALQNAIGESPDLLTQYIQNEIRLEFYDGFLRGPRGTLLAASGNSADRAVLLARLLEKAGYQVRFAEATLPWEKAERLVRTAVQAASIAAPLVRGDGPLDQHFADAWSHFLLIGDALVASGQQGDASNNKQWENSIESARNHVWVQTQLDGHDWINIDPSPGVTFGETLAPVGRVMNELPKALSYRARFLAKIGDDVVLEFEAPVDSLAGTPLGLFHEIDNGQIVPVLAVGNKRISGSPVQSRKPRKGGSLGGFVSLGSETDQYTVDQMEVLQVRITGPAHTRETTYEIAKSDRNALESTVLGIVVVSGHLPVTLPAMVMADIDDPFSQLGLGQMLAVINFNYHALRGALPPSFAQPLPLTYLDSPNVTIARIREMPESGSAEIGLDLTLKSYRVLRSPDDALGTWAIFFDYVGNGILDHTIERAVLADSSLDNSVGALIEAALDDDIPLRVLTSTDDADYESNVMPAGGNQRIEEELMAGRVLLMPQAIPERWPIGQIGWWSVDPVTGWTEDVTVNGTHQAATSRSIQEKETRMTKGEAIACIAAVITLGTMVQVAEVGQLIPGNEALERFVIEAGGLTEDLIKARCEKTKITPPAKPRSVRTRRARGKLPKAPSVGKPYPTLPGNWGPR